MAIPSTTREKLIFEGMRQLVTHGYEGVGIGPVLKAVEVPKGSFYHFFGSKDDFVLAIFDAYEGRYRAMREAIFADRTRTPLARLDAYFAVLEQELIDNHPAGGCLFGAIAQGASGRSPAIRARLRLSYDVWQREVVKLLDEARTEGEIDPRADPADLAVSLVDLYEGTILRVKTYDDPALFHRFRTVFLPRLLSGRAPGVHPATSTVNP